MAPTRRPASIAQRRTAASRVSPDNIAWLFERVIVGTKGQVIYEPILLGAVGGEIFLEVHRDVYRELRNEPGAHVRWLAEEAGIAGDVDWDAVAAALDALRGIATRVSAR
jgi:L,D-transpeptidase ErfK/SrfK